MRALFPRLVEAERMPGKVLQKPGTPTRRLSRDGLFRALRGGMSELVDADRLAAPTVMPLRLRHAGRASMYRSGASWSVARADRIACADAVVVAAPAHAAARLLRSVDGARARSATSVPYVSTASVALGYRRSDIAHPLAGTGFVVARRHNALRITACTWVSSKWEITRARRSCVAARVHRRRARSAARRLGDDELIDIAAARLSAVLGITARADAGPRLPLAERRRAAQRRSSRAHDGARRRGSRALPACSWPAAASIRSAFRTASRNGRRVAAAAADYVRMRHESERTNLCQEHHACNCSDSLRIVVGVLMRLWRWPGIAQQRSKRRPQPRANRARRRIEPEVSGCSPRSRRRTTDSWPSRKKTAGSCG